MSRRTSRRTADASPATGAETRADTQTSADRTGVSRRALFGIGGAAGIGGLAVGSGAALLADSVGAGAPSAVATGNQRLDFYGVHQPGIAAPVQAQAWVTAFDLEPTADRAAVQRLMRAWTAVAAATMAGKPVPGADDAMTVGRGPASLTVTVGFGASMLPKIGLADQVPDALAPLPAFVGDQLDPASSDGDLVAVVAGNDGIVVAHALRALQRAASGTARQRWQMSGFTDAPGVMPTPTSTPRNLMGQIDGTANPVPGTTAFDRAVFVPADGTPMWMRGGSYLVVRRIRMLLDAWDTLDRAAQEAVIGRSKETGAPLSGGTETTPADFTKQNPDGSLAIPAEAHIRVASPQANNGATILRRPWNYLDGILPDGSPNAGLVFLAFQADPRTGFVPIQQKLAEADTLSTFIRHEASALFAIPGGCPAPRGSDGANPAGAAYLGQALLESS